MAGLLNIFLMQFVLQLLNSMSLESVVHNWPSAIIGNDAPTESLSQDGRCLAGGVGVSGGCWAGEEGA